MTYASAEGLRGDAKAAVIDVVYRLADDDLIMGHRNSEWTGLAPILEADIAFSSIAQDQIGQALAYYKLLEDLGEADPDTIAFSRGPEQYRCASLVATARGNWALSTVRLYLYEAAKSLRIAALADSSYTPLAHLVRKLRGEQKYHLMHAHMWIDRLGASTDESHERMQAALDELWPDALRMFASTEWDETIAAEGIGPTGGRLLKAWREEVIGYLNGCGLKLPPDTEPRRMNPAARASLATLLTAMQKVHRLDPSATW